MLGIPFRKALLLLLGLWTFLFFLGQLLYTPTLPQQGDGLTGVVCDHKKKEEKEQASDPFPKDLSFLLLNWNRTGCVKTIIEHAQIYHSFVTEIVIGNNNPKVILDPKDFPSPLIPLRIVNFPQNRYFYARYELCMMAKGSYCYMQDDDWDNKYLRSLYANFLRSPHLLHSTTNAYVHFLSWSWTFFEPNIDLHAGFSWLGTGAIVSKENVHRFIYTQSNLIARENLMFADMYFSTWFNQVPYQLQNELFELDTTQTGFSNQEGGILRNKFHMAVGVQTLYEKLQQKNPIFPRKEEHPLVEERFTKSPCAEDDCLFMTSVHSFPNPRKFIYETFMDIDDVEDRHKAATYHKQFLDYPYSYAVDSNLDSSWLSLFEIKPGDFYGLDLLAPLFKQAIYLKVRHQYQSELILEISLDAETWSSDGCKWDVEYKTINYDYFYRYTLTSSCTCKYRYLRFRAGKTYDTQLQVFDIGFEDKANTWGTVKDTQRRLDECAISLPNPLLIATLQHTAITPVAMREIGNGEIPVTLVILNWKRTHNFPAIFDLLGKYTFVNEYIIWNNNNEKLLTMDMLFPSNKTPAHVSVRIINSPQNLHDYAKYLSCSMAVNDYCYFQDDDWLNTNFRSQYTNFLRFPHLFHSMTIPLIYLEHRRWNLFEGNVGLHAGFSWLGVGSFTSKARVQHFLHQCSVFNLNQDELLQADLFFSYFSNEYPFELATVAKQLDQSGAWSSSVDQWGIVYQRLLLSSTKVYNHLKSGNSGNLIPSTKPTPAYEDRDVRSPCYNDGCLFFTNSYPFPLPSQVPFDPTRTIKEQESVYNSLRHPTNWFWMYNSYDRAVDGDVFTAWSSNAVVMPGDYFGLDLLNYKVHPKFTIVLDHDIANYNVKISSDAGIWNVFQFTIDKTWSLGGPLQLFTITVPQRPFRFISFSLKDDKLTKDNGVMSVFEVVEGEPFSTMTLSSNKAENPSFEHGTNHWRIEHPPEADFNLLQQEKGGISLTGTKSLVFANPGVKRVKFSASQEVMLDQFFARAVVVSVFSKAEDVVNLEYPGAGYSVIIHLTYDNGSTEWAVYTYVFNEGTHGWQPKVIKVVPGKPLQSIIVQLLFLNHQGTVFFDEVTVQEILDPEL